jgi:hypothetical protein
MLRYDGKREEVGNVVKRAWGEWICICIECNRYLLNFSLIHVMGRVIEWRLETSIGVSLGWVEWEKRKRNWEVNNNIYVVQICTKIYDSWMVLISLVNITSNLVQTLGSRIFVIRIFNRGIQCLFALLHLLEMWRWVSNSLGLIKHWMFWPQAIHP